MDKPRILHITKDGFPKGIRVMKEALTLKEKFKVAVLCQPSNGQSEYEIWNDIEIFRPKALLERSKIEKAFELITFYSPVWVNVIKKTIENYSPDILHVHDVWLAKAVFATRYNQFLVADLHENMPAAVNEYFKNYRGLPRLFFKYFHNQKRILRLERLFLNRSDIILTVVQEARDRVLKDHPKLPADKVFIIENLESKHFLEQVNNNLAAFNKNHFSVLYIGGFSAHRGIDTLIRAMADIKRSGRDIELYLIGAQASQYLEFLKKLVVDLDVTTHVNFTNWVDFNAVCSYIMQADLCCVPHNSNEHTDNTIPHKLFQYMIARRPVLVSSSAPLARTVRKANCGLVFLAENSSDCAEKIITMSDNKLLRDKFAENGFRYVIDQGHNWDEESALFLIESYKKMFQFSGKDLNMKIYEN